MRSISALAGAGLVFAALIWSADARGGEPIAAVWKEQRLRFFHMGRTSRYSCDGLRDKVHAMLLDLGARRDLRIEAVGCEGSAARSRPGAPGPSLNIVFSAPALVDAKGKPARAGDSGSVVARFETFTITNDAFRNMGIADCELVEEFVHQILPRLVTRQLRQDITCVPFQSGGRFLVRGEILRTVPSR